MSSNGSTIVVYDPRIENDSVMDSRHLPGAMVVENGVARPYPHVSVAIFNIHQVETKKVNAVLTTLVVLGGIYVFGLVAWGIACSGKGAFCGQ